MPNRRFAFALILWLALSGLPALAQDADPTFKPVLAGVEFTSRQVRPGDPFAMTLRFRNDGTKPARGDYMLFVHFEAPERNCNNIVIHADHAPAEPTSLWQPGQVVLDGPRVLTAPADQPEQEYFVHVGVYDQAGGGERLLDTYDAGTIRVTRQAPPAESTAPAPLAPEEVQKRRQALAARLPAGNTVSLQGPGWRFEADRGSGAWALTDKATGVQWASDPARPRFAEVMLRSKAGRSAVWRVDRFDQGTQAPGGLRFVTHPLVDGKPCGVTVTFAVQPFSKPAGIRLSYDSQTTGDWQVARVRLLENALWVTDADDGRVYVPNRLGIELPAGQGLPGSEQWLTYDGLSMAMCGAVKQGSALLVNWSSVDTRLAVDTTWPDLPLVAGRRMRSISLEIAGPRGACTIHPLGKGGYVEIARAYRPLAKAKGWLETWAEKRKRYPSVDKIIGATDFKPFVFSRTVATSRFAQNGKESTNLGFTFDEAAQCAEHWRKDLGIDRAFVVLAGWVHRGYDNQHPDPLPAAPECGGNKGLQDASARIKACGYLFGLHDNYQDMYEDAPSWGQQWLNKDARGRAKMGGNWAGGQAWQVCAIKQVELAARKETNLPKIAQLFGPTIYFIDTVFAWGLVTCEDPAHPMTRADDLTWKSKLCLLAKKYFGLFGSEEGREWAVPCADYLEGIFGQQTDSAPGTVIPLLPLVYTDCVQIMTHQGNRIFPGDEKKVADHVLFGQMPVAGFGSHLYWKQPAAEGVKLVPLVPRVKDLGGRKFEITYRWQVDGALPADYNFFVHFTHQASTRPEGIAYQDDHAPAVPTSQWKAGTVVEDGPRTLTVPPEFNGRAEMWLGVLHDGQRVSLANVRNEGLRYHLGDVVASEQGIRFEPGPPLAGTDLWARADGGWGEKLCPTDRVIKNTWEVLSPLNRIAAANGLTSHEFVTPDRMVQRTRFGATTVTVAYKPATVGQDALPAYGFVVEGPTYVAFCARTYNGLAYETPTLFTARSLDGKPIAQSSKVRIYHGFGDRRIRLAGKEFEVGREAVVSMR